ncbi:phosphoglycerate mutase-like protein [Pholiota molesta]|nr:phosphoglycerate mutase-like protein [Pholiota molesta]
MTSPDSEAAPLVRIYLVRHGETQANRDGIIQGQQDMALNAMGEEQARWAVKTAEAILAHHPGVELVKEEALRERFMGALEGKSLKELGALQATGPRRTRTLANAGQRDAECAGDVAWRADHVAGAGAAGERRGTVCAGCAGWEMRERIGDDYRGDANERGTLVTYAETAHLTSAALESNADEVAAT